VFSVKLPTLLTTRLTVPVDLRLAAAAAVASVADHLGIHVESSCVRRNESVGGRASPAATAVTHLAPGGFAGDT